MAKYFRLGGRGLGRVLGELECEIMEVLWRKGEATVNEVRTSLSGAQKRAFNTVMTVMNRLVEKGLLRRHQEGKIYHYAPAVERDQFYRQVSLDVSKGLVEDFGDYAVAQFVEALESVDPDKLRELERLIREKSPGGAPADETGEVGSGEGEE